MGEYIGGGGDICANSAGWVEGENGAHLGASGLLIGGDTQFAVIHHRPLRPPDQLPDS